MKKFQDMIQKSKRDKKGFTLVELIVVLVILGILIALLVPALTGWIDRAKSKQARADINLLVKATTAAYIEEYGEDSSKVLDLLYNNGEWQSSDREQKTNFGKYLEEFLSDDVDMDNVEYIVVKKNKTQSDAQVLISYVKDGVRYSYNSTQNPTITEYKIK